VISGVGNEFDQFYNYSYKVNEDCCIDLIYYTNSKDYEMFLDILRGLPLHLYEERDYDQGVISCMVLSGKLISPDVESKLHTEYYREYEPLYTEVKNILPPQDKLWNMIKECIWFLRHLEGLNG